MGKRSGWIGVDLDGTWAKHSMGNFDPLVVGEPIKAMTRRVQGWLDKGITVKVMTARVCNKRSPEEVEQVRAVIQDFTEQEVGVRLEVTNEKDWDMLQLWDDRAVSVETNTGRVTSSEWLDW